MSEKNKYERYQRQVILPEFGEQGQQKLLNAKVLVIGAGGLGCPALQYLAAAGIGTIGIVDHDTVSLDNLHRQVIYSVSDIGFSKAKRASAILNGLNPDIKIVPYDEQLTVENALSIIERFNIIIDGTDNFATRYMINDACVLLDKPLVYGAVSQFDGQVAIFNYQGDHDETPVNYRDLFPEPPKEDEVLNCAEAGVLGVLPGIIGTMQANEAIKLITGLGDPLIDRLWTFNALNNQVYELKLTAKPGTHSLIPNSEAAFEQMNYEWLCSSAIQPFEIEAEQFDELLENKNIEIIDVRELHETPVVDEFNHRRIPMQQVEASAADIKSDTVVLFCQTGKRSKQAVMLLSGIFGTNKKLYSLKGGILNWKNHHQLS